MIDNMFHITCYIHITYCFICVTLPYKCFNSYKTVRGTIITHVLRIGMKV